MPTDLFVAVDHTGATYDKLRAEWEQTPLWRPLRRRRLWLASEKAWVGYRAVLNELRRQVNGPQSSTDISSATDPTADTTLGPDTNG